MINFDAEPRLYLAICNLLLIVCAFLSFYPLLQDPAKRFRFYTYLLLATFITTYIAFRLPVVVYNVALNPDESMFIVGAMTLAENPVYWESVDGSTSGPFSFYAITLFCELFRQPYDYISARIVGLSLMLGSLLLNFFTIRNFFSTAVAGICIFSVIAYLGTSRHPDFVHFGSEHLPIFLLSVISALYAFIAKNHSLKKRYLFGLGFVGGMIPFAKLQAAPIAALIIMITYWLIYKKNKQEFIRYFGVLTLGGLCLPILMVAFGASFGFLDDLWVFYIMNNLGYGSNQSILNGLINSLNDPLNIFTKTILVLILLIIVYHVLYKKQFKLTHVSLFILAFISSSIFAVFKPGFMFHHYLLLLIFPTAFLLGYFLNDILAIPNHYVKTIGIAFTLVLVLISTLIIPAKNEYISSNQSRRTLGTSPISKEILKYSLPHEPLVIWGESGKHYLETRRIQGIRWSHTYWGMYSDSLQRLFKREYVKELQSRLAPVFIDTHANEGTFIVRKACGYETVPELKKVIEENYQFLTEIDQQRIFVRNDRIAEVRSRQEVTEIKENPGAE